MKCDKCEAINEPFCYFYVETKEDLKWVNRKNPCTVCLCAYDCYPPSWKKEYGTPDKTKSFKPQKR